MKPILFLLLVLVAIASAARLPFKAYLVSYPDNTEWKVVSKAMENVRRAGGKITHEYKIFKSVVVTQRCTRANSLHRGFSFRAPPKVLETFKTTGMDHGATVEEDNVVSINGRR